MSVKTFHQLCLPLFESFRVSIIILIRNRFRSISIIIGYRPDYFLTISNVIHEWDEKCFCSASVGYSKKENMTVGETWQYFHGDVQKRFLFEKTTYFHSHHWNDKRSLCIPDLVTARIGPKRWCALTTLCSALWVHSSKVGSPDRDCKWEDASIVNAMLRYPITLVDVVHSKREDAVWTDAPLVISQAIARDCHYMDLTLLFTNVSRWIIMPNGEWMALFFGW